MPLFSKPLPSFNTILSNLGLVKYNLRDVINKKIKVADLKHCDIRVFCGDDASWLLEHITNQDFYDFVDKCPDLNEYFNDRYPIYYICLYGSYEKIKYFIEKDVNLNIICYRKNYPIHYACSDRTAEIIKLFVDKKVNLNVRNDDGYYPLHLICSKHPELLTYIFESSGA